MRNEIWVSTNFCYVLPLILKHPEVILERTRRIYFRFRFDPNSTVLLVTKTFLSLIVREKTGNFPLMTHKQLLPLGLRAP